MSRTSKLHAASDQHLMTSSDLTRALEASIEQARQERYEILCRMDASEFRGALDFELKKRPLVVARYVSNATPEALRKRFTSADLVLALMRHPEYQLRQAAILALTPILADLRQAREHATVGT